MNIEELEKEFESIDLPQQFILDKCSKIFNTRKFVDSHIEILKSNPKRITFKPYYDRLMKFYKSVKDAN